MPKSIPGSCWFGFVALLACGGNVEHDSQGKGGSGLGGASTNAMGGASAAGGNAVSSMGGNAVSSMGGSAGSGADASTGCLGGGRVPLTQEQVETLRSRSCAGLSATGEELLATSCSIEVPPPPGGEMPTPTIILRQRGQAILLPPPCNQSCGGYYSWSGAILHICPLLCDELAANPDDYIDVWFSCMAL